MCEHPQGVREDTSWALNFFSLTTDISDDNTKNIYIKWCKRGKNDFSIVTGCELQNEFRTTDLGCLSVLELAVFFQTVWQIAVRLLGDILLTVIGWC